MTITDKDEVRFWMKVKSSKDGCWEWTAAKIRQGYGRFHIKICGKFKTVHASHISWVLHYGAVPSDRFVCHHCDNPSCIRPDHLFLGDHNDNMKDRNKKGRAACGSRHGKSVLTEDAVVDIRRRLLIGETKSGIARIHGISRRTVSYIANGDTWSWLKGDSQ